MSILPVDVPGDEDFGPVRHFVQEALLKVLAFFGLAFSGGSAAAAGDIEELRQLALLDSPVVPVPPAELALGRLRSVRAPFDYDHESQRSGVDRERLQFMEDITGEPPGPEQLLEAYRRGLIDRDRLETGIRQSRIRNEWIPTVEALRFAPPGAGEVIAGWVENHLTADQAKQKLVETGVDPANHEWLYQTHGRPPGIEQMLDLWNRGDVAREFVVQAIRESDIKDKYIPALLARRRYLPPVRTITALLNSGAIDKARAAQLYAENGVNAEDAAAYIANAHHAKTRSHKELAVTEIATLYQERAVSRADAIASLTALGYDATDSEFTLEIYDLRRWRKFYDAELARVQKLYVGHHIDDNTAQTDMDRLHVAPEAKAELLALWQLERDAAVKLLTEAQIVRAAVKGFFSNEQAVGRLVELGYRQADAEVLVAMAEAG